MDEVFDRLRKSILEYDGEGAEAAAREVVAGDHDLLGAFDTITGAIREVGERFGTGELFLPDLVGASQAMLRAVPIIEEALRRAGGERASPGTVVIGTVFGDIHTIGKTMVATLLMADGFSVHDIGVNVKTAQFVDAVKKHDADILCMSALMTTTAPEQRRTIEALAKAGMRNRVKVMVGGSAITREFAREIGADGYDPLAPGAVRLARRLVEGEEVKP